MAAAAAAAAMQKDEFGPFTVTQVRGAFNAFDLDKNGYIGAAELRHVYTSIGEEVQDEEIDEMIKMVDTDGDGQVSIHEFQKMIFRYAQQAREAGDDAETKEDGKPAGAGGHAAKRETKSVATPMTAEKSQEKKAAVESCLKQLELKAPDIKAILRRFPDSGIAKDKALIKLSQFQGLLGVTGPAVIRLFKLFDHQGIELINIKEVLVLLSNYADFTREDKMRYAFTLYDTDDSKDLSRDELLQILMANHMADSPDQMQRKADAIMRQADTDKGGSISYEEFEAACARFPNLLFPGFERLKY